MVKTAKKARRLSAQFRTTGRSKVELSPAELRASMTEVQIEATVKAALTRFKRNHSAPAELEALRYKLIRARVMQGMMAVEAAEKFGYANSSQLSQIENGERPTPRDWKFLRRAAEVYAVSTDWLLGLSPDMEMDARAGHHFALLRGTEEIVQRLSLAMTTAMLHTARETQPLIEEVERALAAMDEAAARYATFALRNDFEDLPGGAPVNAAHERLKQAAQPLRAKLAKYRGIQSYMTEVTSGTLPPIAYLTERYTENAQGELGLDA
jgi:transcriptional regulator with XRE-family HTH domain